MGVGGGAFDIDDILWVAFRHHECTNEKRNIWAWSGSKSNQVVSSFTSPGQGGRGYSVHPAIHKQGYGYVGAP